jgi:hypothetical protein
MRSLALLHFDTPSSLLIIPDLACPGVVLVAYLSCVDIITKHWLHPWWPHFVGARLALAVHLINPFETAFFQALATLYVVLAARDL